MRGPLLGQVRRRGFGLLRGLEARAGARLLRGTAARLLLGGARAIVSGLLLALLAVSATAQPTARSGATAHDHSTVAKGGTTLAPTLLTVGGVSVYMGAGSIVQVTLTSSTATGTGTNDMVVDNTLPQITEGDQVIASTITPRSASSRLFVRAQAWLAEDSNVSSSGIMCCLFRDGTANTIGGCRMSAVASNAEGGLTEHFNYEGETYVNSTAATSTVFSLRCGLFGNGASATMRWNGLAGGSLLGGGLVTSIVITEVR